MSIYNDMYRKVVCLNDNSIFENLKEASEYYGIDELEIIYCCKGINLYTFDKNDTKLTWKFYEDFVDIDEDSKNTILKEVECDMTEYKDKVICVDTNYIYDDITQASDKTKISAVTIKRSCDNSGIYICSKNDKRHTFMYLIDYMKLKDEEKSNLIDKVKSLIGRPVICLNLNKKFNTIKKASQFTGVSVKSIENNCDGNVYYTRNEERKKFIFMDYERYSKFDRKKRKEEIKQAKLSCITRESEVICLNNKEVFKNIEEASKVTNLSIDSIERCCNKQRRYSIRSDNKRFSFMYNTEYILLTSKERKKLLKKVEETSLKKVVDVESGIIYESVQDASVHSSLSPFTIRQQCNKKENYSLSSKSKYPLWLYYEDYSKRLKRGKVPNKQPILFELINKDEISKNVMDEVALTNL